MIGMNSKQTNKKTVIIPVTELLGYLCNINMCCKIKKQKD